MDRICTSHVERQNLTMRMQLRRLTRLTNAFSKMWANLKAALALYFAWYNFCRVHKTLRMTPAMAAGIADLILREYRPDSVVVEVKKFILPEARHVAVRIQRNREK